MIMSTKVLQINLNHARKAADLLEAHTIEFGVGICLISEPYFFQDNASYFYSKDCSAAIRTDSRYLLSPCELYLDGNIFVAIKYLHYIVASCYISPNIDSDVFTDLIDELGALVDGARRENLNLIIGGDFNAHSVHWGSPNTDIRGGILEAWFAGRDFRLMNDGVSHTCIRALWSSIIDLTWVTPATTRFF